MTGWQGNEGGYGGGWNPQQDPHGGQYGAGTPGQYGTGTPGQYGGAGDQYGQYGQYGQQQPYGTDPYGNPYGQQTSAYPAGYPTGFGPPEPPKRSKLPIILSLVAIVAAVGTVVTIVVLNRSPDPNPSAGGSATSSRPAPIPRSQPPSSRRSPSVSRNAPPAKDGWTVIDLPGGASYQVPEGWKPDSKPQRSGLGVDFASRAIFGDYDCGDAGYFRGFSAAGQVESRDGGEMDLNKTVTDFATSFANTYYKSPKLDAPTPKATTVDGHPAATMTIKLTVTPVKPDCDASAGEVAIVGVGNETGGKITSVRMLVVVNDLAGGPAKPPALPDPLAEEILATLKVG